MYSSFSIYFYQFFISWRLKFVYVKLEAPAPAEEKRLATWGAEVPDDLVLDEKKLAEALQKVIFLI